MEQYLPPIEFFFKTFTQKRIVTIPHIFVKDEKGEIFIEVRESDEEMWIRINAYIHELRKTHTELNIYKVDVLEKVQYDRNSNSFIYNYRTNERDFQYVRSGYRIYLKYVSK